MKSKKFLLGLIAITLMAVNVSCSSDDNLEETTTEKKLVNYDNDIIAQSAISFVKSLKGTTTKSAASEVSVKGIQKMQLDIPTNTRAANTNDYPDFYSVGLNDSMGTVILADKNNTIAPLAYFQGENNIDINEVLEDSVSTLSFILQTLVEQNLDMEEESPTATTRAVTNTIVERLEPKCKVWWGQGYPFNYYCPMKGDKRTVAGCVAIAGAQALTVLRPDEPIISSWDAVITEKPEWSKNNITPTMKEIAALIHEIGINVNMNYGTAEEGGSGAKESDLINYLKRKYGVVDYDCKRAIEVLKTQHGIIIVGGFAEKKKSGILFWRKTKYSGGHEFIADGYVKYGNIGTKRNDDPYYLHINYGWGKGYANEAYILSANKNYTDDAGNYSDGRLYKYNITYSTLTYPSERFW